MWSLVAAGGDFLQLQFIGVRVVSCHSSEVVTSWRLKCASSMQVDAIGDKYFGCSKEGGCFSEDR